MPRIAIVGFSHETNTWSQELFTRDTIVTGHRGAELLAAHSGSKSTIGGFVTDPPDGVELVGVIDARAVPSGPMPAADFAAQLDLTAELLAAAGPVDGVLLSIHGAMVTEDAPDGDTVIAARVRQVVGPDVAIGAVADMHANLDHPLLDQLDLLFPFQTNPHVDARERGLECRTALLEIIGSGQRPGMALEQVPLVVTITKQDTDTQPMRGLLDAAEQLEQRDGVIDVSILEGFPYADVAFLGMSVLVTHRDGAAAADAVAKELALQLWQVREDLQGDGLAVPDAVRAAVASEAPPVLLLDVGDNIGGGSPADATVLLAELISQRVQRSVVILHDAVAVSELGEVVVGDRVDVV
ncbi:MAG TPA: M81 family metallopeptidase, partial [Candidatus Avipropionibacterium avicola]|nr:M81 family metallopeptidase [Candidatus Avipropionibacterium avicola]